MLEQAELGDLPEVKQLRDLLALAVTLHLEGYSLLWPDLVIDVLYDLLGFLEKRWTVGEELSLQILLAEVRKVLGLSTVGAEILFQEIHPGVPRVEQFMLNRGVAELLKLVDDDVELGNISQIWFTDLDTLVCIWKVVHGQVGWRLQQRQQARLQEVKSKLAAL